MTDSKEKGINLVLGGVAVVLIVICLVGLLAAVTGVLFPDNGFDFVRTHTEAAQATAAPQKTPPPPQLIDHETIEEYLHSIVREQPNIHLGISLYSDPSHTIYGPVSRLSDSYICLWGVDYFGAPTNQTCLRISQIRTLTIG